MLGNINKTPTTCVDCGEEVSFEDKIVVEKKTLHKQCFKCAYCDRSLITDFGLCAMEHTFYHRYGPKWYCKEHSLMPPGDKEAQLVKKGVKERVVPKKVDSVYGIREVAKATGKGK